ncbi:MAG: hypothetical protein ACRC28_18705 [Clostridium sp.]|uniref:hypothetical protein n=1 Tax=Clostridium sp. TaxID=1506 RepID=UPI003F320460
MENYKVVTGISIKKIDDQHVVSVMFNEYDANNNLVKDNVRIRKTLVKQNKSNTGVCNNIDELMAYIETVI